MKSVTPTKYAERSGAGSSRTNPPVPSCIIGKHRLSDARQFPTVSLTTCTRSTKSTPFIVTLRRLRFENVVAHRDLQRLDPVMQDHEPSRILADRLKSASSPIFCGAIAESPF